eukprot:2468-Prymnesium_polylepis.2
MAKGPRRHLDVGLRPAVAERREPPHRCREEAVDAASEHDVVAAGHLMVAVALPRLPQGGGAFGDHPAERRIAALIEDRKADVVQVVRA